MISIYGKSKRQSVRQLADSAAEAIDALNTAADLLEANGQSTAAERALIATLRSALAEFNAEKQTSPRLNNASHCALRQWPNVVEFRQ